MSSRRHARVWAASALLILAWGCGDETPVSPPASASFSTSQGQVPGQVGDLSVVATTATSVTVSWTQVDDGTGNPADYTVRHHPTPIGYGWGQATIVTSGECASPIAGTAVGEKLTCTIEGLEDSVSLDFRLVPYRFENGERIFGELSNVAAGSIGSILAGETTECGTPQPEWIWCDDFEEDRLGEYFEHADADGSFVRASGVGRNGSTGMRARFDEGQVSAGSLKLAFGRTPQAYFRPVDDGVSDYREIYWRVYVRNSPSWVGGGGDKLSRVTSLVASESWAQSMIGHVWSGRSEDASYLVADPASGTDASGRVRTTTYNDFANLRWLGALRGETPLFDQENLGEWHCVEARVKLNTPGSGDGIFELWVDDALEARTEELNWVGRFSRYGLNAVFIENYWNAGSPATQERYFDNFVVSTERIGCDR